MPEKFMESYTGWFIDWIEQWTQFAPGYNWRTFHPIKLEFEDDRHMGGVEMTLIIMGLGFRLRWNYMRTEAAEEIRRRVEEIQADPEKHTKPYEF